MQNKRKTNKQKKIRKKQRRHELTQNKNVQHTNCARCSYLDNPLNNRRFPGGRGSKRKQGWQTRARGLAKESANLRQLRLTTNKIRRHLPIRQVGNSCGTFTIFPFPPSPFGKSTGLLFLSLASANVGDDGECWAWRTRVRWP